MRYQIRCVCGHLSAFEIIPMPIEPSYKDKSISDTPLKYHPSCLTVDKKVESLLRVARAAYAYDYCNDDDIERKGFLLKRMRKALEEVKDIL